MSLTDRPAAPSNRTSAPHLHRVLAISAMTIAVAAMTFAVSAITDGGSAAPPTTASDQSPVAPSASSAQPAAVPTGLEAAAPASPTLAAGWGKPLALVAQLTARPGAGDRLQAELQRLTRETRREPGSRHYELHRSTASPERFLLLEVWSSPDALARHFDSDHFRAAVARIEELGLLSAEPTLSTLSPGRSPRQLLAQLAPRPPAGTGVAAEPRLFAPGTISSGDYELNAAFSHDGQTLYFTRTNPIFPFPNSYSTMLVSHFRDGAWQRPAVLPFSGRWSDIDPYLSPDGGRMFFMSNRPLTGDGPARQDFDLWYVDATERGWSEPQPVGAPVSSPSWEGYPAVAASGNLYFFSARTGGIGPVDIYRAEWQGDGWGEPENLGPAINSPYAETNVYVAPDESYLVFASSRPAEGEASEAAAPARRSELFANLDLYASFQRDGVWTPARRLGGGVNTEDWEFCPMVSPDGRYLFFTRAALEPDRRHRGDGPRRLEALEASLRGPGNGLGDLYYVELAALGIR